MAVTLVTLSEYDIDLPGFTGLRFTASSDKNLALPDAVHYALERQSVLQSAREAWAFRIAADGALGSNQYQSTRTAALGFRRDGQYLIAICDSMIPDENILLSRAQEGYDAHRAGRWLVSRDDPLVQGMLECATHEHRVFPALEKTLTLSTGTASPYATHPVTQALLGKDLNKQVATYLNQHSCGNGYVWTLSPSELQKIGIDDKTVEVRRVGVGGVGSLYASVQCYYLGRARGVRAISTGNRGDS